MYNMLVSTRSIVIIIIINYYLSLLEKFKLKYKLKFIVNNCTTNVNARYTYRIGKYQENGDTSCDNVSAVSIL